MIDFNQLTKRYYSISEVAELFNVSNSLLRFWETEFPSMKPTKGKNGIRRYTVKDIRQLNDIYILVKEKKFTIEGAKDHLKASKSDANTSMPDSIGKLQKIKLRLIEISERIDKLIDDE